MGACEGFVSLGDISVAWKRRVVGGIFLGAYGRIHTTQMSGMCRGRRLSDIGLGGILDRRQPEGC